MKKKKDTLDYGSLEKAYLWASKGAIPPPQVFYVPKNWYHTIEFWKEELIVHDPRYHGVVQNFTTATNKWGIDGYFE